MVRINIGNLLKIQALEKGSSFPFDMIISEIGLPDGSGYDLMKQMKHQFGFSGNNHKKVTKINYS